MKFLPDNWSEIFIPELSITEIFLRALIIYFFILFMLRILPRRNAGELGSMDLLLILLISEAASNSLGGYESLADGVLMILFFMGFNYLVNQITYRSAFLRKIFEQKPVQIIKDGKLIHRNMRRELITKDELMGNLRESGVDSISKVKEAWVENEGNLSVVPLEEKDSKGKGGDSKNVSK